MVTVGDCQPRDRLRIVGIRSHSVPPPVKDDAIVAEAKENEHGSNCSPSVHGRWEEICEKQRVSAQS